MRSNQFISIICHVGYSKLLRFLFFLLLQIPNLSYNPFIEVDNFEEIKKYGYDPTKTEDEMRTENNFKPSIVLEKFLPHVSPNRILNSWNRTTSLIVLRHPLDRLVSLYNNKFVHRVDTNDLWANYASLIKEQYPEDEDTHYIRPRKMIR